MDLLVLILISRRRDEECLLLDPSSYRCRTGLRHAPKVYMRPFFVCDFTHKFPVSKGPSSADPINDYGNGSGGRCSLEIDQ